MSGLWFVEDCFSSGNLKPGQDQATIQSVKPGHICLDIGANCGYYTMMMCRLCSPGGMVYSIEPVPPTLDVLNEVICRNGFENVRMYHAAIGAENGQANILFSGAGDLNACLDCDGGVYVAGQWNSAVIVPKVTIYEFVRRERILRVDFIKIDTQGADPDILERGSRITIGQFRPIILCEAIGTERRNRLNRFFDSIAYNVSMCQDNISQPEWHTIHLLATPQ